MNALLWVIQVVCAALFLRFGIRKVLTPKDRLRQRIAWVNDFPRVFVVFVGLLEIAGAIGLVLPGVTGILPVLTPLAAVGLAILMVFGAALHVSRHEYREMLRHEPWFFAAFTFIAWARFGPFPL